MSQPAEAAALARIERVARRALDEQPDAPDPIVLRFLVRAYALGSLSGETDAIEAALGAAVERELHGEDAGDRAGWLDALTEAAALSDDARVTAALAQLFNSVAATAATGFQISATVLDTILRAAAALDDRQQLQSAVDRLEALVGGVYRPGEPLASAEDHIALATTLLTAFDITARLPYAMLAEELLQTARRIWWRDDEPIFGAPLEVNCRAVAVLRRLAALHRDPDYVSRAVIAGAADYDRDAARLVAALEPRLPSADARISAHLGLALLER